MYAVISFAFLRKEFNLAENFHCNRLDECLISVLRFGLIENFLVSYVCVAMQYTCSLYFPCYFSMIGESDTLCSYVTC